VPLARSDVLGRPHRSVWVLGGTKRMTNEAADHWSVAIAENGRSGSILYQEKINSISFYWEFGGGDTVVIIWVEDSSVWSTRYPWAFARRREILERIALEVVRQKTPTCHADIDERNGYIYIREPSAQRAQ
jgi:hypothetical protein